MASEWEQFSLADLYEFSSGLSKPGSAFGSGYPFLSFKDVFYNSAVPEKLSGLVSSTEQERARGSIKRGDVFVTRTSETMDELGMSSVALADIPDATFNGFTKRLRPKYQNRVVPEYSRYYFRCPAFRKQIYAMSSLSTRASLNNEMLAKLTISLPSYDEQWEIGSLLGVLDDRIESLRQSSVTLEAIAQALFKSWFVDFDPVRAKAEGREPAGMDANTAALFHDEFEDSKLGPIPKGWRVSSVGTIAELIKGCSYKGAGLSDAEGAFMFNLGCFNAKRVFATENIKRYTGSYRERQAVVEGDLIMANTDMTQQREILGRALFVPAGSEPGFVSHHVFKVVVRRDNSDGWKRFLFFSFQQFAFRERAVGHATGTTVLALARDSAEQCPIVEPDVSVLAAFDALVAPIFAGIANNLDQAKDLRTLRDALLPRLISGKLRLPAAQTLIEEALA